MQGAGCGLRLAQGRQLVLFFPGVTFSQERIEDILSALLSLLDGLLTKQVC